MFRLLLSGLATLIVARVVFGLVQAIAAGMREGPKPGAGARRAPRAARPPAIDRSAAIDVPYTEIGAEEPPDSGRARRTG
jgi:hypothetical protein